MPNPNRSRFYASALAFLAAACLYLAVPGQPQAAAATCNGSNTGKVCWQNESCVEMLFYNQCTTTYKYFPAAGGGGGGTDPSFQEPGGGGCQWGEDYIGWAPRRCS
jgi:hypothetical protein